MNSFLSSAQEEYVSEKICYQLDKLFAEVNGSIERVVAETNEDLQSENIYFGNDSPANTGYFTAVVYERLFDLLHGGDIRLAKTILEMAAKRTGLDICFKR